MSANPVDEAAQRIANSPPAAEPTAGALRYDPASYGDHSAAFYDQIYAGIEAGMVERLLSLAGVGPALELGIGTGRVVGRLLARGLRVDGVEASVAMITRLRERHPEAGIRIVAGDFSRTSFGDQYALIYSLVSTFYLLPSIELQQACLHNIARHLRPAGRFVSEAFAAVDDYPQATTREYPVHGPSGIEHYRVTTLATPPAVLDGMAAQAGLRLEHRWSDWRGTAYRDDQPRHISVYCLAAD